MKPNRAEIRSFFSKKFLFQIFGIGAIFLFLLPLLSSNVKAQTNSGCSSAYGSCPSGQISVEKTVQNPKTGEFVQSLSANDATFAPNGKVDFRIKVKNIGSVTLTGISVQDQLPDNINFISSSPTGAFKPDTRTLNWTIDSLGSGESSFFQVVTQVMPQNKLHFDIACMTNFVQAQQDRQTANSFAAFCIQSQTLQGSTISNVGVGTSGQVLGVGVTTLPKTGLSAAFWVVLSGLLPLGFKLRKFRIAVRGEEGNADYIYQLREFLKEGGEIDE